MDWSYLFFRFDGRISRKPFWIAFCVVLAADLMSMFLAQHFGAERLGAVVTLALVYPEFAVIIKRAHDRETPIWILILYLVLSVLTNLSTILELDGSFEDPSTLHWIVSLPLIVVFLYLVFELGFRRGVPGPNRFGPNPLEGQT